MSDVVISDLPPMSLTAPSPASILLVDDVPANLLALAAVLKPLGARIVEAKSGQEAIDHVTRESFAVALLDVQMPGMDGFEAADKIRTLDAGRELPIIFLTAIHRDDGFVKRGYNAGAADYITKPFDADIVRARVRAFVKLYEQREATRRAQLALRTHERDEAMRRLVAFERISTAAIHSSDLPDFLNELLGVFMSAAPDADSATIMLLDGEALRVAASVGELPSGNDLAQQVARERRPLEAPGRYALPLLSDGEVIGVARIGTKAAPKFEEADKRLFGALVERAAWAVSDRVKRERLHEVLASAPAMISIVKSDNTLAFENAAYTSYFGAHQPVEEPLVALANEARAAGDTVSADEVHVSRERVLRVGAKPLRNYAGTVDRVVLFSIDVTSQSNLRELERAARVEAETASRMKDEFLATVSHELRTPLNAILGWTVTARAKAPKELDRALAIVERNARAQARMIEDVLDVSRVASGKLRLDTTDVVLDDALGGAMDAVKPAATAKNIEITTSIAERIVLRADSQRLQQVLWNILSNAIKFTPRDGHVTVDIGKTDDSVQIRITDDGEGIDPQFVAHVFEPFRQADASTTRRHGGLGLGLAIVKQIVDAHGGTIAASSDGAGKGATFTLAFPTTGKSYDEPRVLPSRPPAADGEPIRLENIRILVVDDDEDARTLLAHILAERGATTAEADSANAAFQQVERFRPSIIVSDIAMPGGDGYGLIRAVRQLPPDRGGKTPAIAVTAHARQSDGERAFAAGFQAHVSKPVDLPRLIGMIATLAETGES